MTKAETEQKACAACGPWWQPGSRRCPEHDPLAPPRLGALPDGRPCIVLANAEPPKVMPRRDGDWWIGMLKVRR